MFKCGFYEKEITPPLDCDIPGYFLRRKAVGVSTRLYAKAVAIEADGKAVIMITIDAENLPKCVYDRAVGIIKALTGIDERYVMINATHTHIGGPVENPSTYEAPYFSIDMPYIEMLGRMVGDCGVLAYQRLEPMTAKYAMTNVTGIAFVRNYIMTDGSIMTNPGYQNPDIVRPVTESDSEFPVFFFFDESGKPRGMISNFALHHDSVRIDDDAYASRKYNSDYSGVLANEMKQDFGHDFVSIFINGTCGDINHCDFSLSREESGKIIPYIRNGKKLADAARELYKSAKPFEIDCVDAVKETVDINRREISDEEIAELKQLIAELPFEGLRFSISQPQSREYRRARAERMLNIADMPKVVQAPIQALRFGECVLYAIPSEVYVIYGKYIKANSPSKINLVAELANGGPSCYIPSVEIYNTTSYESAPSSAPFEIDTGERYSEKAIELGKKIYNK